MNNTAQGPAATYDLWLGLISQMLGQIGGTGAAVDAKAAPAGLAFPADQVARAAAMMQETLQRFSATASPMLLAAGPSGLLAQWAAAPGMQLGPMLNLAKNLAGEAPQAYTTGLDRTFGGLNDALGLGPARMLQATMQDVLKAGITENDARAKYMALVLDAFVAGFEGLLTSLVEKAEAGERVESGVALLRLWAQRSEDQVHSALQSEPGLAATAALSRAGVAKRRKLQLAGTIVASALDMATRKELDEAFREIQQLKRELRSMRKSLPAPAGGTGRATAASTSSRAPVPARAVKKKAVRK